MFTKNYAKIPKILEARKRQQEQQQRSAESDAEPEPALQLKIAQIDHGHNNQEIITTPSMPIKNKVPDLPLSALALAIPSSSSGTGNKAACRPISMFKPQGDVKYIFSVSASIMKSIITNYPQSIRHNATVEGNRLYCLIGTISSNGWIQIMNLETRRTIFQIDTTIPNCSWASIIQSDSEDMFKLPQFVVTSRSLGTYIIKPWDHNNEELVPDFVPVPNGIYPGFFTPYLDPHLLQLVIINGAEEVITFDMKSEQATTVLKLEEKRNVTFLIGLKNRPDLILLGSEKSDVILVSLKECKIIATLELKDELQVPEQESEETPIPLCCTGNEETGNYVVGSSTPFLVKFNLILDNDDMSLEFVDKVTIPASGISHLCIPPTQDFILGSNWTFFKILLFTFPSLDLVREIVFNYTKIYSMNFVVTSSIDNDKEEKDLDSGALDKQFYLAVGTNDSMMSVWKIL